MGEVLYQELEAICELYGVELQEAEESDDPKNVPISELKIAMRMKNALYHKGCNRLYDIERLSKDDILLFRNIGEKSYCELLEVCAAYGVILYGTEDLNELDQGIEFSYMQYCKLFDQGIKSKEDVQSKTLEELKEVAEGDGDLYKLLSKLKALIHDGVRADNSVLPVPEVFVTSSNFSKCKISLYDFV